ncbi:MAG: hypothetical protein ONA90_11560 [candidate division KSB1 bacterium]|nr:hypothetical protein [candidate division KSB1 bacterium]
MIFNGTQATDWIGLAGLKHPAHHAFREAGNIVDVLIRHIARRAHGLRAGFVGQNQKTAFGADGLHRDIHNFIEQGV